MSHTESFSNPARDAYWNARVKTFYVTGRSAKTGKTIQIGKPHATIQAARLAGRQAEARRGDGQWLFIDSKKPGAR